MSEPFQIAGVDIAPGESKRLDLFVAKLYDHTDLSIPVKVLRGTKSGPTLFLSAAIHGDEIVGTEIIKRVLVSKALRGLRGNLIAVPIVNVFGYNGKTRYLPDRRDLNRCFPGSSTGSLAARMADLFFSEIVRKSTYGIDLHTGALHRSNLPQIRTDMDNPQAKRLALAFGAPVIVDATYRDGSLRQSALDEGIPVLLYECGEALRVEDTLVKEGCRGVLAVMREIGMLEPRPTKSPPRPTFVAKSSHWLRAPQSGSMVSGKRLGAMVKEGEVLGIISDPFGQEAEKIRSRRSGVIIGKTMLPLVNRGDALFHIATVEEDDFEEGREFLDGLDPTWMT